MQISESYGFLYQFDLDLQKKSDVSGTSQLAISFTRKSTNAHGQPIQDIFQHCDFFLILRSLNHKDMSVQLLGLN